VSWKDDVTLSGPLKLLRKWGFINAALSGLLVVLYSSEEQVGVGNKVVNSCSSGRLGL
jgi:hypothetical protein